jgi:DNA-binding winged helix-turn-helix (wHTH) protein
MLLFDRFRFDGANQRLEDGSGAIRLNPKAFEVLRVLVEHPDQLVLKDQLLDAVWPDTHVADGVLKVCMAEIRKALGDSATTPRFIETVHRRGYRFVAKVTPVGPVDAPTGRGDRGGARASLLAWPPGGSPTAQATAGLVGRGGEIDLLEEQLARCCAASGRWCSSPAKPAQEDGARRAFSSPGRRAPDAGDHGEPVPRQCGSAEAYMPVLEAVGRLVREDGVTRSLLRRYAPTWFAQFPGSSEEEDRDGPGREPLGTARERMLREMAEFVEALGAEIPRSSSSSKISTGATLRRWICRAHRRCGRSLLGPRAATLSPRGLPSFRTTRYARSRSDWRRAAVVERSPSTISGSTP